MKETEKKIATKIFITLEKAENLCDKSGGETTKSVYAVVTNNDKHYASNATPVCYVLDNTEEIKKILKKNILYTKLQDDCMLRMFEAYEKYEKYKCNIDEVLSVMLKEMQNMKEIRKKSSLIHKIE